MPTFKEVVEAIEKERRANPKMARLKDENVHMYLRETYRKVREWLEWPTQAEAARVLDMHRAQVGRWIKEGKLRSNGMTGHQCRVDPVSVFQELCDRYWEERAGDGAWNRGELT